MRTVTYTFQYDKEGTAYSIWCLDTDEFYTSSDVKDKIKYMAADCTEGWLEIFKEQNKPFPKPKHTDALKHNQFQLTFDLDKLVCTKGL